MASLLFPIPRDMTPKMSLQCQVSNAPRSRWPALQRYIPRHCECNSMRNWRPQAPVPTASAAQFHAQRNICFGNGVCFSLSSNSGVQRGLRFASTSGFGAGAAAAGLADGFGRFAAAAAGFVTAFVAGGAGLFALASLAAASVLASALASLAASVLASALASLVAASVLAAVVALPAALLIPTAPAWSLGHPARQGRDLIWLAALESKAAAMVSLLLTLWQVKLVRQVQGRAALASAAHCLHLWLLAAAACCCCCRCCCSLSLSRVSLL